MTIQDAAKQIQAAVNALEVHGTRNLRIAVDIDNLADAIVRACAEIAEQNAKADSKPAEEAPEDGTGYNPEE